MRTPSRRLTWLLLLATTVIVASGLNAYPTTADGVTGAAEVAAAPARLEVDLSERVLKVMVGEDVAASYSVAVGTGEHPTPTGTFQIRRIVWNPSWTPPDAEWARDKEPTPPGDPNNPMGRVKIFFSEPDYYIHGTENESSLGSAASHGCLRMRNSEVIELARTVMENGGEARSPNWFRRIINRIRDTEEVRLSTPVTVTVRS